MDTKYLQLLLLATIFISFSTISPSNGLLINRIRRGTLVKEFCSRKGTDMKKTFCLDILNSDPRTSYARSYFTLFNVTMEKAIINANKTRNQFQKFSKLKPQFNRTLDFCVFRYDTVLRTFKHAISQVASGKSDLDSVTYDIAMTYDYASQCKKRMDADGVHDVSLEKMSDVVMDHTRVCYAMAVAVAQKTLT